MAKTLRVETDDQNVMTVWLDHAERSVNTFTPQALSELAEVVGQIAAKDGAVAGVIFASAKPNVFVAGADLFEMREMNAEQTLAFLEQGQKVFDQIAVLPMPTVAAINGQCLGGGCELALACDYRVAADCGSITIGLPETKLGILPAWGGTTRLPRLVGLTRALPVLLAGKTMPPRKARSLGLVDDVVRPEALLAAAHRFVRKKPAKKRPGRIDRLVAAIPALTHFVANKARQQTQAKTFGNYPAADRVIDVALVGLRGGHAAGLKAEREAAAELAGGDVARNLLRLFFLRQGAKADLRARLGEAAADVHESAVIGGGIMGAGIVHALLGAGLNVRLVDISPEAVGAALARVRKMLEGDVRSKRLSRIEADRAFCRVVPTTDYTGLKLADVVIEAVSERPDIKAKVFATLDERTRADAILASNTSSLDIGELAKGTRHPNRVIGLHFFNPVPRMPLVEIVRTTHSDDRSLATGLELALAMGKTPVLVNDAPGFLVNRVLFPYLAEALHLAVEGASFAEVDRVMKRWGMPMGPYELFDQVGLDVSIDIFRSVTRRLGDHLVMAAGIDGVLEKGWRGRKSGRGFYVYGKKGREPQINQAMAEMLRGDQAAAPPTSAEHIQWRLLCPMINETARLLQEGVVDSTDTVDLATVLGLGLAPFRGGLARFVETVGLPQVVAQMDEMAGHYGNRFEPVAELRRIAEQKQGLGALVPTAGDNGAGRDEAARGQSQHA